METETARVTATNTGRYRVHSGSFSLLVDRDELQAIVQAAYDQHGILATPSYATEAERAPQHRGCPCGLDGCSDPMPAGLPETYLAALAREPRSFA